MIKEDFFEQCDHLKKSLDQTFDNPIVMKVLPSIAEDDGRNAETRIEKFFNFAFKHKHTATLEFDSKGYYTIYLFPHKKFKKIKSVCGHGATIGLALNDLWEELQEYPELFNR